MDPWWGGRLPLQRESHRLEHAGGARGHGIFGHGEREAQGSPTPCPRAVVQPDIRLAGPLGVNGEVQTSAPSGRHMAGCGRDRGELHQGVLLLKIAGNTGHREAPLYPERGLEARPMGGWEQGFRDWILQFSTRGFHPFTGRQDAMGHRAPRKDREPNPQPVDRLRSGASGTGGVAPWSCGSPAGGESE